jgi:hypothetical protein
VAPRAPLSSTGAPIHLGDVFLRRGLRRSDVLCSSRVIELRQVAVQLQLQLGAPGREIVPARAARGLRIRGNDRDAGLHQVGPVVDLLRIALAHQEHDRRGVRRAVLREACLPVRAEPLALALNGIDVVRECKRDDVRRQPVDHGAGLTARAAVRLLDRDLLAGARLPVFGKLGVQIAIQLARRVIAHIQQRDVLARAIAGVVARAAARGEERHGQDAQNAKR